MLSRKPDSFPEEYPEDSSKLEEGVLFGGLVFGPHPAMLGGEGGYS